MQVHTNCYNIIQVFVYTELHVSTKKKWSLSHLFTLYWNDDDGGGSTYLWNVGRQLFYTTVHPRRQFWTSRTITFALGCRWNWWTTLLIQVMLRRLSCVPNRAVCSDLTTFAVHGRNDQKVLASFHKAACQLFPPYGCTVKTDWRGGSNHLHSLARHMPLASCLSVQCSP
jgi:hypothetical protein